MGRLWQKVKDALEQEQKTPVVKRSLEEAEFLPAALEVLETPPSRFSRFLMGVICTLLFVSIAISWFGFLDTEAVAEGKVIPVGQVKSIQSLIAGRVEHIEVRDGDPVVEGQLLIKLNQVESTADKQALRSSLLYYQLGEGRIHCLLLSVVQHELHRPDLKACLDHKQNQWTTLPSEQQWLEQQQLLDFDYDLFISSDQAMGDLIDQKKAAIEAIEAEIERYRVLLPLYEEQEKNIKALFQKSYASKTDWLAAREKQVSAVQQSIIERKKLLEIRAALASSMSERDKQVFHFKQSRMQQRVEFSDKIEELKQALVKAEERDRQSDIRSPVSGTVQNLDVHYEGAVIEPAKPLMVIVPSETELQVEAMILNKDIGFVRPGMLVDIKIESFPYTFYGYIQGVVQTVSRDAIITPDGGLVYPTYIELDRQSVVIEQKQQALQAGMTVTAEVKTGKRRVLEFFIEPFLRYRDEAFNVR